jgi:hypothetical protein
MAFMLGSFTQGMFSGFSTTMDLANKYEEFKAGQDYRKARDAAQAQQKATQPALPTDTGAQQAARDANVSTAPNAPYGRGGENSPAHTTPSYEDYIKGVPTPAISNRRRHSPELTTGAVLVKENRSDPACREAVFRLAARTAPSQRRPSTTRNERRPSMLTIC